MDIEEPVISEELAAIYRELTPQQRFQIAMDMNIFARALISQTVANEHPDWTPEQIQREVVRIILETQGDHRKISQIQMYML